MAVKKQEVVESVTIPAIKETVVEIPIKGDSAYVQCRFSQKALEAIRAAQLDPASKKRGKKREPRNYDADYEGAKHISAEGWCGIPASAIRTAAISACRLVGFKMTLAKLTLFIEPDGVDRVDAVPLVRIYGNPEKYEAGMRPQMGGMDIRVRPMWREWTAKVRVRFDSDQFKLADVVNLITRVGRQVGIGEGRPDSRDSAGVGWGLFSISGDVKVLRGK
jgi:hypothetical protein